MNVADIPNLISREFPDMATAFSIHCWNQSSGDRCVTLELWHAKAATHFRGRTLADCIAKAKAWEAEQATAVAKGGA